MKAMVEVTLRFDSQGRVWALNKRETGWSSFGYVFSFLGDALDEFSIALTGFGRDQHGLYMTATPVNGAGPRVARCLTNVP